MVETSSLLRNRTGKTVPRVRISHSPPAMSTIEPSVLFHACCGPCATVLIRQQFYFNGDNFISRDEYDKRLEAMLKVGSDTIVEPYNPKTFDTCEACIKHRLEKCAQTARQNGFTAFSTTLTVSPHKNTAMINEIGRAVSAEVGIPFIELDLKKGNGFARTVAMSRELGLYRQNFCGCKKSKTVPQ